MSKKKLYTSTFTFEGKRYYVRSSVSQRDADRKADAKKLRMEEGRDLVCSEMRFERYASRWLETYKAAAVSSPVYDAYESRLRLYVLPRIGHMSMRSIRQIDLQGILNSVPGKSRNFYVKLRDTLEQIFAQALRDRVISDTPADRLSLPAASDGSHRSITEQERAAIIEAANTHRMGLFVLTILWCGLRPQEAAALRWEDIDRVGQRIHICRALKADGSVGYPKSAAGDRLIPIPPQLWSRIQFPDVPTGRVFRNAHGGELTKSSIKSGWDDFLIWVDVALGAELERDADGQIIRRQRGRPCIVKSALPEDLTLYCLRHTYCTDLQAAGVPIDVARYLMGHSDISLTSKIYTHMRDDTFSRAAQLIAEFGATVGATSSATPFCQNNGKEGQNHAFAANPDITEKVLKKA